jgi:histidine ammonia-lyase
MTAARHALEIVNNTSQVLAIELYTAARALDIRLREHPERQPGIGTRAAHRWLRKRVPYQAGDTLWGPEIDLVRSLIDGEEFLPAVDAALA